MSDYETVLLERRDGVALLTLNRPDSLNAFSAELRRDLGLAVAEVNADDSLRVAVLTGSGRAFCAGADLLEVQGDDFDVRRQLLEEYKPVLSAINESSKPWISAVNGAAAGIGSAFAMVCDLTVMAENAFLYQAFTAIGLVPDGGATWHLARTIGRKRAYEMIVTGEKLRAERCLELGLCNRVVPSDELLSATMDWAKELAGKAPLSLRYAKQALNSAMEESVADTISSEAELQHICINSADAKEGVTAFVEKREPKWQGK
ncbi:enoyl-CoA hydratase/isomerase family protein [Parahaliea sp. F7430]|uniref:Enoyl-CoA hydratase/isomerase family protein n=1 Tax=Sediminihaliea albiluteola TaxID=2758564 RepID=A0A7W2TV97_9GAMM|nr:enoyl-CoA hydratase/isomerase family protein [Sediminihaliea albiluteola]MBA6412599.1 enoyl-CoA hydratase/isomerase family protein [Sediminihaliea albiluteola]